MGAPAPPTKSRRSLTERVYDHLLDKLAARAYAVGTRLSPQHVANELRVSRSTVTKAFSRLIDAGWVGHDEHRHAIVVAFPPAERKAVEPFEFSNQTDATYESLLERVVRGDYELGQIIKERPLAQELGVNPATVRRAAEWLEKDGLVERLPRRGWQVVKLDATDLTDVYDIRLRLEPVAVQAAASRIPESALDELEERTREISRKGEAALILERRQTDYDFHHTICLHSGHRVLTDVVMPLVRKSLLLTTVGFRFTRTELSFGEHLKIIKELRSRDARAAVKAMKAHLRISQKMNVAYWERR